MRETTVASSTISSECESHNASDNRLKRLTAWLTPVVVLAISGGYLLHFEYRGWCPHDEGTQAQCAERILDGELPHRDFDDPYTGGLAFFHAVVFRVFGMNLAATRAAFFGITLLFVATLYLILRQELTPLTAGVTTLMGVAWSLPNYFSAVPSWYILYLSTFGLWALLKYLDSGRRRWLVAAGCWGGLGVLMKIVGLFYLAAAFLFLVYHEQSQAKTKTARDDRRSPAYFLFIVLVAMTPALLLALLTRKVGGAMTMIQFVVPMLLLALTLIWNEWNFGRGRFWVRVQRLLRTVAPFVIGVLLPIVPFLAPYVASGALGDLYHGLFVLPQKRFEFGVFPLPDVIRIACPATVLAVSEICRRLHNRRLNAVCIAVAAGSLAFAQEGFFYRFWWDSLRCSLPLFIGVACWILIRNTRDDRLSPLRRQRLFLASAVATLVSVLQYPFSAPIYFCFTAPLLIVVIQFAFESARQPWLGFRLGQMAVYTGFAFLWMNFGTIYTLGYHFDPHVARHDTPFEHARAGLLVSQADAEQYSQVLAEIAKRTTDRSYIYAAPDCPEIYFLSGRRNPTRTLGEFFEDPNGRAKRIAKLLDDKQVQLVVLNLEPSHSNKIDESLNAAIKRRFPKTVRIGHFELAIKADEVLIGSDPTPNAVRR